MHARPDPPANLLLPRWLADTGAVLYSALRATAWAEHARLVPVTGEGLALWSLNQAVWQPLSHMRVDAWADFSTRLKDGEVRQGAAAALLVRSRGQRGQRRAATARRCFAGRPAQVKICLPTSSARPANRPSPLPACPCTAGGRPAAC